MSGQTGGVTVTGASGVVGRAVVRQLVEAGRPCTAFVRRATTVAGARTIVGHLGDDASVRRAVEGADAVVHAAGLAHAAGLRAPHLYAQVNTDGTRTVAEAAARAGVERFVLISTAAVYGPNREAPSEDAPPRPVSAYACSKLAAEREAEDVAARTGMRLVVLRPPVVVGPGDPGSIAALGRLLARGRFVWVGAGRTRKMLIDVDDLARACLAQVDGGPAATATFNTGGCCVTLADLVHALARELDVRPSRLRVPEPVAHVALAAARPLGALAPVRTARARLGAWLSEDVQDARRYEAAFGPASRVPWTDSVAREARWLRMEDAS
ncbi:MAG: NAD-dependent epimerase/dehydratase family protein [Vicinamibacterales bacterium]